VQIWVAIQHNIYRPLLTLITHSLLRLTGNLHNERPRIANRQALMGWHISSSPSRSHVLRGWHSRHLHQWQE